MKRILCIGDSNTYGYDPRSYFGSRYPKDVRWTGILVLNGYEVVNEGLNGRTFPRKEDLPALFTRISELDPLDAIVILLGTNDLLLGKTVEEIGCHATAMLQTICEIVEASRILLIAPPILVKGEWVQEEWILQNSLLLSGVLCKAAVQNRAHFTDSNDWGVRIAFDGVHFSPEGHQLFAVKLLEILKTIR